MQGIALRWVIGLIGIAGLIGVIGFLYMNNKNLTLERDAAKDRASRFESALSAYRTQFADQVKALNAEKRAEILRQENLLRTFNLIGDLDDEKKDSAVPDSSLCVIDSLYGTAKRTACDTKAAGHSGLPDTVRSAPSTSVPAR